MTLQKPRNFTFTLKGNAYQNFEYGLNSNAEATKKNYRYALERYGWYIGSKLGWAGEHTPDGFIFKDDVRDNKNHQIESLLSGWISKLQEGQRLKSSSVRQFVAAIKLFYEMNSIALPWKKIKRGIKRTNPHKDRAYTREEIKLLLSHAGLRLRAIILLLSSSGVRVGALPALKLGHDKNWAALTLHAHHMRLACTESCMNRSLKASRVRTE